MSNSTIDGTTSGALEAVDKTAVAVLAFRDSRGQPMAWPVTPYIDGGTVVVTSTLAYIRKTEHVRRDGRVALLCGSFHLTGQASVHADTSGDEFVSRFLPQELKKYPPGRQIVGIPGHRLLFSWYFGRVFMEFRPDQVREVPGPDRCTLITLDESGFPNIVPISEPDPDEKTFELSVAAAGATSVPVDGPATVLSHVEPTMSDLRQLVLRGDIRSGAFHVRSKSGTLAPAQPQGWLGGLQQQLELHRRGRKARKVIQAWEAE